MDQEYFRRFARRCRELMLRTTSEGVREQLRLWATEFEARAEALQTAGSAAAEAPHRPNASR